MNATSRCRSARPTPFEMEPVPTGAVEGRPQQVAAEPEESLSVGLELVPLPLAPIAMQNTMPLVLHLDGSVPGFDVTDGNDAAAPTAGPMMAIVCAYCARTILPAQFIERCEHRDKAFYVAHNRRHKIEWPCPPLAAVFDTDRGQTTTRVTL